MDGPEENSLNITADNSENLPGKLFKEIREAKKMTHEEVAERLNLQIKVIIALENDDYSNLPSDTYVKGYLRNYARLLNIPLNKITFLSNKSSDAQQILPENINYTNDPDTRKSVYFWISGLLFLILIIFSGL